MEPKSQVKHIPEIELPIDVLVAAPWNWKLDEVARRDTFRASLQKNGILYRLVVAQRAEMPESDLWEVCDGNHRLVEYQEFGLKSVFCYSLGRISLAERMRVGQELNGWEFQTDQLKFAQVISTMLQTIPLEELVVTNPLTETEINNIVSVLDFDFSKLPEVQDMAAGGDPVDEHIISFKLSAEQFDFFMKKLNELPGGSTEEKLLNYLGYGRVEE